MSYQRIKHPSDLVKEGDTLKLVVLSVDPAARKMSFSLKQAGPDPWKTVSERYATDMTVTGTVTRVVDFGAFVELEAGLEGLIHVSELSNQRVRSASDAVKPGQEVKVRILEIDAEARRISLSLKRAAAITSTVDTSTATPAAESAEPQKPKKKKELKGGLDWGWQ
jgi:small subunit ribosomal protein S1